jgi:crotonobetaine/carnitine-CoA ligase
LERLVARATERLNPYNGADIPWLLASRVVDRPGEPFLIWEPRNGPGHTYTYAEFASLVRQLAGALSRRGVRTGDRVLVHMDNSPSFLLSWFACAELGATAVTTNTKSSGPELEYFAGHAAVVGAITQPRYLSLVTAAAPALKWLLCTSDDVGEPAAPGTAPGAEMAFEGALGGPEWTGRPADAGLPLFVQYTSGTTARPKGVVWSHANGLWGAQVAARHEDLRPSDRHMVYLPLFHVNALVYSILSTLWMGGSAVLMPGFSSSRYWEVSLRHRCTWGSMIPFAVRTLLEREVPRDHTYRVWGFGRCDPGVDAFFGVKTIGWWGMTETVSHGVIGDVHLPNQPLSIGRPAVEYELSIEHADGSRNQPGEVGELLVRGTPGLSLFAEYLDDPAATARSFDDAGWFHTGDLVSVSAEGYVFWVDRSKDMLKVGGENVAASEVEAAISKVPGVAEAAVVSKSDQMLDEVPVAFVVPQAPDTDPGELAGRIDASCRTDLAAFKVPREIYVVPDLPRSTLEKVAKPALRERVEGGAVVDALAARRGTAGAPA